MSENDFCLVPGGYLEQPQGVTKESLLARFGHKRHGSEVKAKSPPTPARGHPFFFLVARKQKEDCTVCIINPGGGGLEYHPVSMHENPVASYKVFMRSTNTHATAHSLGSLILLPPRARTHSLWQVVRAHRAHRSLTKTMLCS